MGRLIKKDTETRLVNEHDPKFWDGSERTDGKRWNLVQTNRFPDMLVPERDAFGRKHNLRRCERAKGRRS